MRQNIFSRAFSRGIFILGIAIFGLVHPTGSSAAVRVEKPLVLADDMGGLLRNYLAKLDEVERTGRQVEIRGKCYSSCTIFLSASHVCVSPEARLGFHGPRYRGKHITPDRFDYWSRVMAEHYPPSIARWYMSDARFKTWGVKIVTGENIMTHGIPACK